MLDRRFLGVGVGSGLLGSICCFGSALAVGAGVGGLSFFTTWMERYQVYFVVAGAAVLVAWLALFVRRARGADAKIGTLLRGIGLQVAVMAAVYVTTLVGAIVFTRLIVGGPM